MNNLSKIIFTCSVFMCASMFAMDNVNPAMDNANPTSQSVMSKVCNFLCHPIRYFRGRNITEQRLIESDDSNIVILNKDREAATQELEKEAKKQGELFYKNITDLDFYLKKYTPLTNNLCIADEQFDAFLTKDTQASFNLEEYKTKINNDIQSDNIEIPFDY